MPVAIFFEKRDDRGRGGSGIHEASIDWYLEHVATVLLRWTPALNFLTANILRKNINLLSLINIESDRYLNIRRTYIGTGTDKKLSCTDTNTNFGGHS